MANIFDEPVNPELFAGKTFYIAAGLFKEYEDKLISDIQAHAGLVTELIWESDFIIHNPPSAHEAWYQDYTKRRQTCESNSVSIPAIRPYHWVYTCIHSRPCRIIKSGDPEYTQLPRLVQHEGYVDYNGMVREITRPLRVYCTINMPPLGPEEESCSTALKTVLAKLESHGGFRSLKRGAADMLILDTSLDSGKKFKSEAKVSQTVVERSWIEELTAKTTQYVRGRPPKGSAGGQRKVTATGTEMATTSLASGSKTTKGIGPGEGGDLWLKKPSLPFKGPAGGRTEFTEKDEDNILRWLVYHHPQKTNWKSIAIYKELCDKTNAKYLYFADRHTAASWHERVRKRYPAFSSRSAQYTGTNVALDRHLRTRAERAKSVQESGVDTVRTWIQGVGPYGKDDAASASASVANGVDKGKGKATAADVDREDADSFAATEDGDANGKRKRIDSDKVATAAVVERNVSKEPVPKKAKHSDEVVPIDTAPDPKTTTAPDPVSTTQTVVVVQETQIVTESTVVDIELSRAETAARPAGQEGPPNEIGVDGDDVTAANVEDRERATDRSPLRNDTQAGTVVVRDESLMVDTVRRVVDAVATAYEETFESRPTQQVEPTQQDEPDSFALASDDEMEAMMIAEQKRARLQSAQTPSGEPADQLQTMGVEVKQKDKRLSTLSERQVNDLVLDGQETSMRSEGEAVVVQGMQVDEEAKTADQVADHGTAAGGTVQRDSTTDAARLPAVDQDQDQARDRDQNENANEDQNQPQNQELDLDPRRRATSSTGASSRARRPVQTTERAAHIVAKTTRKFGVDVKTVLSAMQYVVKHDPNGQIPIPELWRLLAEDQKDGFERFGGKVRRG